MKHPMVAKRPGLAISSKPTAAMISLTSGYAVQPIYRSVQIDGLVRHGSSFLAAPGGAGSSRGQYIEVSTQ